MNLYLRYFDQETLVENTDEAIDFLHSIPQISLTADLENDIREYAISSNNYPKRYKIRPRIYFIIIKTDAQTMQEFKEHKTVQLPAKESYAVPPISMLLQHRDGWYEGSLDFKRVTTIPGSTKCQYIDTNVIIRCKATCGQECYDRIVEYLRTRVDSRSQFPAAKGKNFSFKYLGMWK